MLVATGEGWTGLEMGRGLETTTHRCVPTRKTYLAQDIVSTLRSPALRERIVKAERKLTFQDHNLHIPLTILASLLVVEMFTGRL